MQFLQALGNFFKKFFKKAIQDQLSIIVPIAQQIVKTIENDPSILSSTAKRDTAIAMILAELAVKEMAVPNRLINLAIEIAVVEFKGVE